MRPERLRALLQVLFMLLLLPVLASFQSSNSASECGSPPSQQCGGSDSAGPQLVQAIDGAPEDGVVWRSQHSEGTLFYASLYEGEVLRQSLPSAFIGLRLPTSADGSAPGQLWEATRFNYQIDSGYVPVTMTQNITFSARLNALFPPGPDAQWVALTIQNPDSLNPLLDKAGQPVVIPWTDFSYGINFGGSDLCVGCEVQMVECVPSGFGALLPPGTLTAASQDGVEPRFSCTQPSSTYIVPWGGAGLSAAPVVAGFGLWSGEPTTSPIGGQLAFPLTLQHTAPVTVAFDLKPIQSALGYTYTWTIDGTHTVTRVDVPVLDWDWPPEQVDVFVTASGLPTCTQAIDVLDLRATSVLTPSLQAKKRAYIQMVPDMANCPVTDLAAHHVQHTTIISGGASITYTLTVTNRSATQAGAILKQTLKPADALDGQQDLPDACTLAGAVVTCELEGIPAQGEKFATVALRTKPSYDGSLYSTLQASPAAPLAVDGNFLDNVHGPLEATIQKTQSQEGLLIPLLLREK